MITRYDLRGWRHRATVWVVRVPLFGEYVYATVREGRR